jgi:hypothetical protein
MPQRGYAARLEFRVNGTFANDCIAHALHPDTR